MINGLRNAKEHVDFLTEQQALNTIELVLDTIVTQTIDAGKDASEQLEELRNEQRKEIVDG